MRIITGSSRGRRLAAVPGRSVRPTSDRIKESIFNILGAEVEGKDVLDLFAGTGNLGMEALSRGARSAVFVENGRQALTVIEKNLRACGMQGAAEIIGGDVLRAVASLHRRGQHFDLILIDPPYRQGWVQAILRRIESKPVHHEHSALVLQHDRREPLPDTSGRWEIILQRRIGDTIISLLAPKILVDRGE